MQISTKARYAVMALVDMLEIQRTENTNKPIKLDKISRRQEISLSYLEQLFMALRRGGVVNSVRGPGGGYILSKDAADISLMDIIIAVNEPLKFSRCNGMGFSKKGKGCMENGVPCNTHELWNSLGKYMDYFFKNISLQCILDKETYNILSDKDMKSMLKDREIHEHISGQ